MRTRVTLAVIAAVLVVAVVAGWYAERSSTTSGASTVGGSSTYRVRVTRQGRELASYDLAALQSVGVKTVVVQGGQEQGPPLLAVLSKAGVDEFSAVTIIGPGVRDEGRLELSRSEIGEDTVLDVAKRGTVKIAGPAIPREKRVRDIMEIQVR